MTAAAIAQVLTDFGVEIPFPDRRLKLAGILAEEGFTPAQIEAVGRQIELTTDLRQSPAVLHAALTGDLNTLRHRAAAAVQFLDARMRREDPAAGRRNVMPPTPPCDGEPRNRRVAWARVMCDHAPLLTVAAEMGLSVGAVRELVEAHRAELERAGAAALPMLDRRSGEVRHVSGRNAKSVFQANQERDAEMAERRRKAFGDAYEQAGRPMPSNVRAAIGGAP